MAACPPLRAQIAHRLDGDGGRALAAARKAGTNFEKIVDRYRHEPPSAARRAIIDFTRAIYT